MERKKNIIIIVVAVVVFCIVFSGNIYNSIQSHKYRIHLDTVTESLIATENANRELTDRIGRVAEITRRIKETTDANITDARGIIELTEELRAEIKELEDCCGGFDYNKYYQYWDNEFRDEGLIE